MTSINKQLALDLLVKLVEIPSYISPSNPIAEANVEHFLSDFFKKNLPEFSHKKISFAAKRNDLFFYSGKCRIIFACHMDTVPAFTSAKLSIKQSSDKIYGLGTKDMKGGIVSTLLALLEAHRNQIPINAGILFYGDEEYGQAGIRKLVEKADIIPKPKLILSPESRFNLGYGARGMVVFSIRVTGKRAHSSRPHQGIDAIQNFYQSVCELQNLYTASTPLGNTTITITRINGGLLTNNQILSHHGTIPDVVDATISVRVADLKLNAKKLISVFTKILNHHKLTASQLTVIADYPPRYTNPKLLQPVIDSIESVSPIKYGDPATTGYNDAALLSNKLKVPLVNFGPYGENNHNPNEWVSLNSLTKTAYVFYSLIQRYG